MKNLVSYRQKFCLPLHATKVYSHPLVPFIFSAKIPNFESHLHSYQSVTMKVTFLLPTTVSFSGSKITVVYAKDRLKHLLCVIRRGSKMLLNWIGNDAQKTILSTEFSRIPFVQKLIIKKSQIFSNCGQMIPSLGISAW